MRDAEIRVKLKNSILKKYYSDNHSRVVNELSVGYGDAIIDLAVINGSFHGYEIKSEFDSLIRLPKQITIYCKTFDFITIISAKKHLNNLIPIIPEWCGIILIDHNNELNTYRKPKKNKKLDNYSIAQLLWKSEVIDILKSIGINKGLNYKSKQLLWTILANSFEQKILSELVREKLKIRVNWKSEILPSENDDCLQLYAKL